jgi:hypothetical protein
LVEVLEGKLDLEEWERKALGYAKAARVIGVARERLYNLSPIPETQ